MLTAEEVAGLVEEIKERVIKAAESGQKDEPPEELARRLAEAFDSVMDSGPEES